MRAYAKINLGLRIIDKRPDGYHTIDTVFHRVRVFDELQFIRADSISVASDNPQAPGDPSNLCHRAAVKLQEYLGVSDGVAIRLSKQIPVGAGLGGGSADAAAVLLHLPTFWGRSVPSKALAQIALSLGSDIPYFLTPGTATGGGRGEILTYFPFRFPYAILLCNPGVHVSTAWAYGHVTTRGADPLRPLRTILEEGIAHPDIWRKELVNDFEAPVAEAYPVIGTLRDAMLSGGALHAMMSGSGSTVFGIYASPGAAAATAEDLEGQGLRCFLTPPYFAGEEPDDHA